MSFLRPVLAATLTAAACLCAAGAVALSGGSHPVQAAASTPSCSIHPDRVVLRDKPVGVSFGVQGSDSWSLSIPSLPVSATSAKPLVAFDPKRFTNADAGLHAVTVSRSGDTCRAKFRLVRATSLSLGVRKDGGTRVLSGRLLRVNLGKTFSYNGFAGAEVVLQRQTGSRWVSVRMVTPGAGGAYSARITIGKRDWRAVYAGSGTSNARFSPVRTDPPVVAKPKPAPSVSYKNCTAAWNAGAAPLHRSDPGYRSALDADHDGIACEVDPR